ncbi:hypothetical protein [Scytonema hofmannii]|nr:hypothetical protein [Scytonema hofmannii]
MLLFIYIKEAFVAFPTNPDVNIKISRNNVETRHGLSVQGL